MLLGPWVKTPNPVPLRAANENCRGKAAPSFKKYDFEFIIKCSSFSVAGWRKCRTKRTTNDKASYE